LTSNFLNVSFPANAHVSSHSLLNKNLKITQVKIYIKSMVTIRCKMVVRSELEKLGFHCSTIELGEAETIEDISPEQMNRLNIALKKTGLALMVDQKSILVEKIKQSLLTWSILKTSR
jgi:hypothetical protein